MTEIVFFLEDDLVCKLSGGPFSVNWGGDSIGGAGENRHWEFQIFQFILWSVG